MEMNKSVEIQVAGNDHCELCGQDNARKQTVAFQFEYRHGDKVVLLMTDVPVIYCPDCQETYMTEGAQEAQHDTICRYLGRLTPREIIALRKAQRWSQAELAKQTGIGIASIKRWETGILIQSASMDNQLRSLMTLETTNEKSYPVPQFRKYFSLDIVEKSRKFLLRNPRLDMEYA